MNARHTHTLCLVGSALCCLAGCFSLPPPLPQPRQSLAHISSDYRIRAAAPLNVYLRSVDGRVLRFWHNSAEVEAGEHRLLVDCAVTASQQVSRHELNVSVDAGVRYRLDAEATSRDCTAVRLIELPQ